MYEIQVVSLKLTLVASIGELSCTNRVGSEYCLITGMGGQKFGPAGQERVCAPKYGSSVTCLFVDIIVNITPFVVYCCKKTHCLC